MRVVHFVHRLPPEHSGAGRQALALVRALAGLPGEPRVESRVVSYAEDAEGVRAASGSAATIVPIQHGPLGKWRQYRALSRALDCARADVLHVHGYHRQAVFLGRRARTPVVLKTTLLGVDDVASIRAKGPVDRRLVDGVARVVSLTRALENANRGAADAVLVPNGIDTQAFAPRPCDVAFRREHRVPEGALLCLFLGGDSVRKGARELPSFWARLRRRIAAAGPHLLVAGPFSGDAGLLADALARAAGTQDATVVPGLIDAPRAFAAADVFLSLSSQEGLPNAVLEAAASDTFVFALDQPGTFDEVLDDHNALIAPTLDDAVIENLARRLLAGDHEAVDNRRVRADFALATIAARYRSLYAELVRGEAP